MPEFKALTAEGDQYVDACLLYLSDPAHGRQKRRIAEYSMNRLSLPKWIYFANEVIKLHDRKLLGIWDVMDVVFHVYRLKEHLSDNFLNPEVRAIMYNVRNMPDVDDVDRRLMTSELWGEEAFFNKIAAFARWIDPPKAHK